jgi:hypothetical protein
MKSGGGPVLSRKAEQSDTSGEGGEETKVGCGGECSGGESRICTTPARNGGCLEAFSW